MDEGRAAIRTDGPVEYDPEGYEEEEFDNEEEHYSREGRKTLTLGIVLASLICVVGVGLYFVVSNMLQQEHKIDVGSGLNNRPVQVTTNPSDESGQLPGDGGADSELPGTQLPGIQEQLPLQAYVLTESPAGLDSCVAAGIEEAEASSVLEDGNVFHVAEHMVDGRAETSWQESSDGDGTGEWVSLQLDRQYAVRYITFKLGNWKSEHLYYANSRPAAILLKLDEQEVYLEFPDSMRTFTVELSRECAASRISVQVQSVYAGSNWSDCCISEMTVYGN
ncbi:MAG: hypothetical protein Q4B85_12730 [Lachnospiraceae bacterium]|nr:hypothetical protein [Lachnospiraceae bacterium]